MILLLLFEQLITLEDISFGNDTQKNPPCPSQSRRQVFCALYSLAEEDIPSILPRFYLLRNALKNLKLFSGFFRWYDWSPESS
jgi:hypothetical protein